MLDVASANAFEKLDLWSCPFRVIDIETTGSVAGRHAVTEIALVEVAEGRIVRRWRSFVNPRQPIPHFITALTGITDEMVAGAPLIGRVLPDVVDFIGDAIVVGHNVRFDAGFIEHELRAHGHGGLANPMVDTLVLARRTIAEVANYRLGTLTRELGIDVERHHRALADATATAHLLVHCIRKLEDHGVFTYGSLLEYLHTRAQPRRRASRSYVSAAQLPVWTSILRDELQSVPSKPGVYLLKDAGDGVVYVGKSRNLRQRLRAYATAAIPAGPKLQALRGVVASFDFLIAGSEFEALLLEARLVRQHDPQFNAQLRNYKEFAFIKLETGVHGRVLTTTRLAADGARYYGPYRSMLAARAAVAALQDALGLPGEDAPASDDRALPPGRAEALIDEAIAFLEDGADEVLLATARRRDEAAARGRYDVARREEQRLERLRTLRANHASLEFAAALNVLVFAPSTDPASEQCFLFCGGRLSGQCALPRRLPQRDLARATLAQLLRDHFRPTQAPRSFTRQDEIDQVSILAAWYRERRDGLAYVDLPAIDPSDALATRWAAAALDGERLDVRWEVPQHQAEQHQEAGRQEVEQECGAAIMAGAVLDLAG
ncbi:MAG TPA: exonuclease domain-containing protein [Candidatus Eremiobacteraceae bacterium]|nr:exonuclease domain-containing protein [Candidatus Eremiobacteraceae bacterium]